MVWQSYADFFFPQELFEIGFKEVILLNWICFLGSTQDATVYSHATIKKTTEKENWKLKEDKWRCWWGGAGGICALKEMNKSFAGFQLFGT